MLDCPEGAKQYIMKQFKNISMYFWKKGGLEPHCISVIFLFFLGVNMLNAQSQFVPKSDEQVEKEVRELVERS